MLHQTLEQRLLQKLSPQQIQLMKLLQIPSVVLEQRIKEEIEENPALELGDDESDQQNEDEFSNEEKAEDEFADSKDDDFDINDYLDDDVPDYALYNQRSKDEEQKTIPYASGASFVDLLIEQLGFRLKTEKQKRIGEQIIGNLDDAGYLERPIESIADDLSFYQNIHAEIDEILEVLEIIQDFDPPGIGARNLQECLLIQLKRKEDSKYQKLAVEIIQKYFEEFSKKHYDKIIKKLSIDEDDLKKVIDIILTLNPKPANSGPDTVKSNLYVIPEFIVSYEDGILDLIVNSRNIPDLRVSRTYAEMLNDYSKAPEKLNDQQKQTVHYVKQKIDSARWFIDAIKQRQNTLYLTMNAIMNFQRDYFMSGDETELKPMILKDIADIVNLDISTVSRVANSKYVQTPYGTFLLKTFFSESLTTDSGEEVSSREVKKILQDAIEAENKKKPLADEQITKILKDKGYNIARRTVAKYREALGIPVARLRKEL